MKEFIFSEQWYWFLLIAFISYLVGGVSAARIISRYKNKDITKMGSGNPGSMNMTRNFGIKIGVLTLFFDALKAAIPVVIVHLIYKDYLFKGTQISVSDYARYMSVFFVVMGHIFPLFNKFKGGKGIAPTFGGFWAGMTCEHFIFFFIVIVGLVVVITYIVETEWGAMGSLFGISLCTIVQCSIFVWKYGAAFSPWRVGLYANMLAVFLADWLAHRKNLRRLFAGEEHRTALKAMAKKKKEKKID